MDWPANSPYLNPIENMWSKLKKVVQEKSPICKEDLIIAIRKYWKEINIVIVNHYLLSIISNIYACKD